MEDALKSKTIEEEANGARIMSLQREIESLKEDTETSASAFNMQIKSHKDDMMREKIEVINFIKYLLFVYSLLMIRFL